MRSTSPFRGGKRGAEDVAPYGNLALAAGEWGAEDVAPYGNLALAAGEYTVTLTPAEGSTVKGYCSVKLGDAVYTTSPIFPDATAGETSLSFTVTVAAETTVVFTPKWGYPAAPNLANGDTVSVPAAPADPDNTPDA